MEVFILLGASLGLLSFLIWLIFDVKLKHEKKEKDQRGFCPICGHPLKKGERLRSNQVEIPKFEIRTFIKGCPYCLGVFDSRKRICPVCKSQLEKENTILAVSYFDNPKKLIIKGCRKCYPEGYQGYESKYQ
ncbi:MAG: hypothetical protein NZ853_02460 [Leptospiraceae bacterium]|nr:hypothetical protein [Leptospiraceae bacterium]MDW7975042.1 hypothetical protein [Leptospiraceae bacterium]